MTNTASTDKNERFYKFLLMDSDLTLLNFDAELEIAIEKMYERAELSAQLPYSKMVQNTYESCNNRWWENFEQGLCEKHELFVNRFVDFLDELKLSGSPEELNEIYFDALAENGIPLAGALDAVKKLSESHVIYIVTNGYSKSAWRRLENAGFAPYLKGIFVSEDVGYAKPSREYFDYVEAHIPDFERASAIVIGDSLTSDITGANNAGLDSLWFNWQGHANPRGVKFTFEAATYDEMINIVSKK